MALPQAVQNQVEQAEALQQHLYAVEEQATAQADQTAPIENAEEIPSNVVELPKQAEPVQEVTPTQPVPDQKDDVAYWKQKFDSLRGKFDAEVPTLYQQLKEQNAQLQKLAQQLQERESAPTAKEQDEQALVTSKDVDDYGADLVDMVRRAAQEVSQKAVTHAISELRKEFGAVKEQMGTVTERVYQSESDKFWAGVMNLVPDWKQIDADPRWIEFLDTTPEFAEDTYRELAGKAIQRGDATKIAKLVETWRVTQGIVPAQQQQQAQRNQQQQAELARQVAPTTSKAGTNVPTGEKIWSREEYEVAMDVRNVRRLGQAEADRLEAEANRAVAEGRVRW